MTDVSTLFALADPLPPLVPAGIIFHVSRCGSTLLANALKLGEGVVVLSESRPIGTFFHPDTFRLSPFPAVEWHRARTQFLDAVTKVYGHRFGGRCPRLVIKCHTASIMHMSLVRAVWPSVPFIILIRNPIEVVVSNLAVPSGWVRARLAPLNRRTIFGWSGLEADQMSVEEYCARGLGEYYQSVTQDLDDSCRVLDYDDLNPRTIAEIGRNFGIVLPSEDSPEFQNIIGRYSKDPTGNRRFEQDRVRKQWEASSLVREAARQWADTRYRNLRELGQSSWRACGLAACQAASMRL